MSAVAPSRPALRAALADAVEPLPPPAARRTIRTGAVRHRWGGGRSALCKFSCASFAIGPSGHHGRSASRWMDTVATSGPARDSRSADHVRAHGRLKERARRATGRDRGRSGQAGHAPRSALTRRRWQPIVDALADTARRAGAVVRCHAKLQELLESGGVWLADVKRCVARRVSGTRAGVRRAAVRNRGRHDAGRRPSTRRGCVPGCRSHAAPAKGPAIRDGSR